MEHGELCDCGNIADRYCDFYFFPRESEPTEENLTKCDSPLCASCTNEHGSVIGLVSAEGKTKSVNDTIDYCDKHNKVYTETGAIWERT